MSANNRIDLTLFGAVSDMELLAIVDDVADDEDGWARTLEVRLQLGEPMDKGYRSGVGPRLAWMVRYGWLERDILTRNKPGNERRWRLTPIGQTLLDNPKLTKALETALSKMNPAQRLVLTKELAEGAGGGAIEIKDALRRQWTRSLGGRR